MIAGRSSWCILIGAALTLTACGRPSGPSEMVAGPAVLVGAGDIGMCETGGAVLTGSLLDGLAGIVFTAGDNAYPSGTADEFGRCYGPGWGRHLGRTRPSPGNHDYVTPGAADYFAYFGERAGPAGLGYYIFTAGSWRIVSLNSNVAADRGSAQYQWLAGALDGERPRCLAAIWHHPLFSSGQHGPDPTMQDVWRLLQNYTAEFVISGHDHLYERFAPLDADGRSDPGGVRQFVVGTGGATLTTPARSLEGSEARVQAWGVLKVTLDAAGYSWEFHAADGGIRDTGSGVCR